MTFVPMKPKRIDQLKEFHKQDPKDPFTIYAIALEYLNSDNGKAKLFFDQLLREHNQYLPTYYHAAQFYVENNDPSRAKSIYQSGIALAEKQGDDKTRKELDNALTNLLFEED